MFDKTNYGKTKNSKMLMWRLELSQFHKKIPGWFTTVADYSTHGLACGFSHMPRTFLFKTGTKLTTVVFRKISSEDFISGRFVNRPHFEAQTRPKPDIYLWSSIYDRNPNLPSESSFAHLRGIGDVANCWNQNTSYIRTSKEIIIFAWC